MWTFGPSDGYFCSLLSYIGGLRSDGARELHMGHCQELQAALDANTAVNALSPPGIQILLNQWVVKLLRRLAVADLGLTQKLLLRQDYGDFLRLRPRKGFFFDKVGNDVLLRGSNEVTRARLIEDFSARWMINMRFSYRYLSAGYLLYFCSTR